MLFVFSLFPENGPAWLVGAVNGWRGVCALFGSRFAGNGSVLILDVRETVEGGLFVSFEVWFARNGTICIANTAREGLLCDFGSGLRKTAPFSSWTLVED